MEGKNISFGYIKTKTVEKPFTPILAEEKRDYKECVKDKSTKVVGGATVTEDLPFVIPMKTNSQITAEKLKKIIEKVGSSIQEPEIKEELVIKEEKIEENEPLELAVRELMQEAKKDVKVEVPDNLAIPTPAKPVMTGEKEVAQSPAIHENDTTGRFHRKSTVKMSTKKHLRSQGKEIIARVYHRMKYEAENGIENVTDARWRTAQAVGYSEHTISNILKEERQQASSTETLVNLPTDMAQKIFKSPSKRKRMCPKSTLDDFDVSVLRRTIMSFHVEFNEMLTLKKLREVLSEKIGFHGCTETLRKILRETGYEWSTTDDNRKILVEKHDIQMLRFKYLKQLKKYRDEGRYIVYTGLSPLQKKLSKGMRVIIVHAGGCQGFVPNACLIFKASSTSGNYHDNMNFENYKTWLTKQLLPNLPKNSVIVMDNASYHNVVTEKNPTSNSNKNIMQAWLTQKNIPYEESMEKIELYDLITKNKDKFKSFAIDELVTSKGFEVLRIPLYHPDLNPIEKIWGILNNYIAKKNVGQNFTSIIAVIKEQIEMIDCIVWENTCRHVNDIEKQYMKNFDMDFEFIINVESDSDESD